MSKKKWIAGAIGVVVTLGVAGGAVWGYKTYQANTREVSVQPVSYINWGYWGDTETSYGMVTNDSSQEIYLSDAKNIKEVYVKQGDKVKVGDPLIAYDTAEVNISIERKKLDINTSENNLAKAQYRLNWLWTCTTVDKTMPEMDDERYQEYVEADKQNNAIPEKDAKDSRVYNYLTADSVPFNAYINGTGQAVYPAGTSADPYIFYCNENAYAYGSFYNAIRPSATEAGKYVKVIIPKKDANGNVEIDGTGNPIADTSLVTYEKSIDGNSLPADYEADKMWYVFSGNERTPSNLAGQYRDEFEETLAGWEEPEGFTFEEWVEELNTQDQLVKELDIKVRQQRLELESLQRTASDGIVYAEVEGEVKTLGDVKNPPQNGTAFLVVTGDEGLYVSGTLSELSLGDVTVGTVVTANSWESGMTFEATITEISDYPTSSNSWGDGNPNVSYYGFTAYIEDSSALRNGEYVDLQISTGSASEGGLFIDKAYVREENGRPYCMIADENGRLKKQYIVTGRTVYGSAIEIKSGLTEEDLIAFPYGKDVVEGAITTQENNMYY